MAKDPESNKTVHAPEPKPKRTPRQFFKDALAKAAVVAVTLLITYAIGEFV